METTFDFVVKVFGLLAPLSGALWLYFQSRRTRRDTREDTLESRNSTLTDALSESRAAHARAESRAEALAAALEESHAAAAACFAERERLRDALATCQTNLAVARATAGLPPFPPSDPA